jgi:hypothetical protein
MKAVVREEIECIKATTCPSCFEIDLPYVNSATWIIIKCRHSRKGCTYHQHAATKHQKCLQGAEKKERVAIFNRLRQHEFRHCKYRTTTKPHAQVSVSVGTAVALEAPVSVALIVEKSIVPRTLPLILSNNHDNSPSACMLLQLGIQLPRADTQQPVTQLNVCHDQLVNSSMSPPRRCRGRLSCSARSAGRFYCSCAD